MDTSVDTLLYEKDTEPGGSEAVTLMLIRAHLEPVWEQVGGLHILGCVGTGRGGVMAGEPLPLHAVLRIRIRSTFLTRADKIK